MGTMTPATAMHHPSDIFLRHPLLGDIPALHRDPLGFLIQFTQHAEKIVRLKTPCLPTFLLLGPEAIEHVLVTEHHHFGKPVWLRTPAVRRLLGKGLVTSDGERWLRQRRLCGPAFHPRLIPGYAATMTTLTERMLKEWHAGQERLIQHDMARLTVEIVTQVLLGADSGGALSDQISQTMDTLMQCFSSGQSFFGLLPLPPLPSEAGAIHRLDRLVDQLIHTGHSPDGEPTLLALLQAEQEQSEQGSAALREQVKTFLAAGHESSALALTWAFLLLARHPEAEAKMIKEVETVCGGRLPAAADFPFLPCTQAVIQETLRLYPPLWMTGRKALKRCEIEGMSIPARALILTSPWVMQRHPGFFPEPSLFRPERWRSGESADLPRFAYFPFGGGPRICIGQGFALMEMTLVLATIAKRFRLTLDPSQELTPWATMTLRPPQGIRMRLEKRRAS